jgi:hypothetical protein
MTVPIGNPKRANALRIPVIIRAKVFSSLSPSLTIKKVSETSAVPIRYPVCSTDPGESRLAFLFVVRRLTRVRISPRK